MVFFYVFNIVAVNNITTLSYNSSHNKHERKYMVQDKTPTANVFPLEG